MYVTMTVRLYFFLALAKKEICPSLRSCGQLGSVDVRTLFVSTDDLVVDKLG